MNLSDQVTSLELSKKLKELSIKQESIFWHYYCMGKDKEISWNIMYSNYAMMSDRYSAFTCSELSSMLPSSILKPDCAPFDNYRLVIKKFISVDEKMNQINNFIINYECDATHVSGMDAWLRRKLIMNIYDPNLANAMAMMLIFLIENDLVKVEDLK